MAGIGTKLASAVETYLADLRHIRDTGGATSELSYYPPLNNLLNAVGALLKPKVFSVSQLAQQGAGHPDFGLYAARQMQRGSPREGQVPERGVVEVKPVGDDAWLTASGGQVSGYWQLYRLVLVTNTRDFVLLGEGPNGEPVQLETFRLADSLEEFEAHLQNPDNFARDIGASFGEYLCRVLSHPVSIVEPEVLAWHLASYARDGLVRVEKAGDAPSLRAVREALEEALGVQFQGDQGAAFFRSTLVQTLFYGVFSAWALWARDSPPSRGKFDWRTAGWYLRVPVLRALFQQLSDPGRLQSLGLVEVLDWTADALDRVDRDAFFDRFDEGEAVQYFYEPFLEAFDPDLRKQLGVWYTPAEAVRYMVARADRALKDDLGIADGLADENVYVLDPCCGTGAYLAETLRRIDANLRSRGEGAVTGALVKRAATRRVFGFEIMPAPFVVAHLQVGLAMQALDAPLSGDDERAGVFLTNALTGWEPTDQEPLPFPELEDERDRADNVKQNKPILVIIGNPPYNGFAGMAVDEERELSEAYRETVRVRRPEGQGLNDLYVRFFRMAERRIAEKTGRGVVCFISNYSWLDGLSFTGMRERLLDAFDTIRIDNLHGDRIISEYAPDGQTSETVMAIRGQSPGIKVGTAIALLSKSGDDAPEREETILYRDFHQARAEDRRKAMLDSLTAPEVNSGYSSLTPNLKLGLPFKPMPVNEDWHDWPSLPDLFPTSFPGVKTSRDSFLVDIDSERLKRRVDDYFSAGMTNDDVAQCYPNVMTNSARFDGGAVRDALVRRGGPINGGFIRYSYRPFDNRWLYWDGDTKLLDEKRAEYKPHVFEGNWSIVTQKKPRRDWSPPQVISNIGCLDLLDRGATCFPAYLRDDGLMSRKMGDTPCRPNLSDAASRYLERLGLDVEDLFHHVLAVLHDPSYRDANAGALRMEWPRVPLPNWPEGDANSAAAELAASAARGRELAALLDTDSSVPGVIHGTSRPELAIVGVPSTIDGSNMTGDDFAITEGWGYIGQGQAIMPSKGRAIERPFTTEEMDALGATTSTLGETTFDVYLNKRAYWRNVPAAVWNYKLGGYQVLKKWLSYRERKVLGRPLLPEEVRHFTDTARRIAGILGVAVRM